MSTLKKNTRTEHCTKHILSAQRLSCRLQNVPSLHFSPQSLDSWECVRCDQDRTRPPPVTSSHGPGSARQWPGLLLCSVLTGHHSALPCPPGSLAPLHCLARPQLWTDKKLFSFSLSKVSCRTQLWMSSLHIYQSNSNRPNSIFSN